MSKFIIMGEHGQYIVEAEDWSDAVYEAQKYFGDDGVTAIIKIPEEES